MAKSNVAKIDAGKIEISVDEQLRERSAALAAENHRLMQQVAALEGKLQELALVIQGLPKAQWRRDIWVRAYLARSEYADGTPAKAAAFADAALAQADQRF